MPEYDVEAPFVFLILSISRSYMNVHAVIQRRQLVVRHLGHRASKKVARLQLQLAYDVRSASCGLFCPDPCSAVTEPDTLLGTKHCDCGVDDLQLTAAAQLCVRACETATRQRALSSLPCALQSSQTYPPLLSPFTELSQQQGIESFHLLTNGVSYLAARLRLWLCRRQFTALLVQPVSKALTATMALRTD